MTNMTICFDLRSANFSGNNKTVEYSRYEHAVSKSVYISSFYGINIQSLLRGLFLKKIQISAANIRNKNDNLDS